MAGNNEQRRKENGSDKIKQKEMHKSFFDRCNSAIDNGFYMEAVLMEYAAIEARLEVMLGLIGLPCNQFIQDEDRRKINISHRIKCIKKIRINSKVFDKSKLPNRYFDDLGKWVGIRNGYIHGLYKNEVNYSARMRDSKKTAEKGLELCRLLYNETGRIRRLINCNNLNEREGILCYEDNCKLYSKN